MSKYQLWHDQIIQRARSRELDCYSERHHIVPRSMGGTNESHNIVQLTYQEHFIIHWLLSKITSGRDKSKMLFALRSMTRPHNGRLIPSWRFAIGRKSQRKAMKGYVWPADALEKRSASNKGSKRSKQTRLRMSKSQKSRPPRTEEQNRQHALKITGRKASPETKAKMSASHMGHQVSNETKRRIAETNRVSQKGKKLTAQHKQNISAGGFRRYAKIRAEISP